MSELSFGIIDNNTNFQQKAKQLREAINGLETDFARCSGCSSSVACEYKNLKIR